MSVEKYVVLISFIYFRDGTLIIECSQVVEMLSNNIISPYVFRKEKHVLKFSFHYATSEEYIQRLNQLHGASNLPTREQQEMIEAIVYSRHSRVMFDPCWLEDLYESIVFEARVTQVSNVACSNEHIFTFFGNPGLPFGF